VFTDWCRVRGGDEYVPHAPNFYSPLKRYPTQPYDVGSDVVSPCRRNLLDLNSEIAGPIWILIRMTSIITPTPRPAWSPLRLRNGRPPRAQMAPCYTLIGCLQVTDGRTGPGLLDRTVDTSAAPCSCVLSHRHQSRLHSNTASVSACQRNIQFVSIQFLFDILAFITCTQHTRAPGKTANRKPVCRKTWLYITRRI